MLQIDAMQSGTRNSFTWRNHKQADAIVQLSQNKMLQIGAEQCPGARNSSTWRI